MLFLFKLWLVTLLISSIAFGQEIKNENNHLRKKTKPIAQQKLHLQRNQQPILLHCLLVQRFASMELSHIMYLQLVIIVQMLQMHADWLDQIHGDLLVMN